LDKPRFYNPSNDTWLTDAELSKADADTQFRVMRHWFHQRYTDPAENTPYESAEGGYQYIWGGPYDPKEELEDHFSGITSEAAIEELGNHLQRIASEWTGNPDEAEVDDYLFDAIGSSEVYRASLKVAISTVEQSLAVRLEEPLRQNFLRMLYGNVIAALEAYLSDFFISAIKQNKLLFRRLVESVKEFREQKIPLSNIFKAHEGIEGMVKEFLLGLSWHNIPRVRPLYKDVLGVEFDESVTGELISAVAIRHDIVHRNGKTKDGAEVHVRENEILKLLEVIKKLVKSIEDQWLERNLKISG
jgi:hypothetical protein